LVNKLNLSVSWVSPLKLLVKVDFSKYADCGYLILLLLTSTALNIVRSPVMKEKTDLFVLPLFKKKIGLKE
tara:strand:- start:291 stop:503 length:213 start_codon:yes stop_codon:yes gene_type:complete